jgi:O-antigen ligase
MDIGAIFGALFILFNINELLNRKNSNLLVALLVLYLSMLFAGLINYFTELSEMFSLRDFAAIIYSSFLGLTYIKLGEKNNEAIDFIVAIVFAAICIQCIPLILNFAGLSDMGWMRDDGFPGAPFMTRYVGFATNPNQIGLLLAGFLPLLIWAIRRANSSIGRFFLCITCAAAIAQLIYIQSSTLYFTTIGICVVMAIRQMKYGRNLYSANGRLIIIIFIIALLVLTLVFAVDLLGSQIGKNDSDDANGRFPLWISALDGIGQSLLLGVGPGAQSGLDNPFQGFEAHNTVLDLALQGGVIALCAYFFIWGVSIRKCWQTRFDLPALSVFSMIIFQNSHYIVRHPLFWIYLLFPLVVYSSRASEY